MTSANAYTIGIGFVKTCGEIFREVYYGINFSPIEFLDYFHFDPLCKDKEDEVPDSPVLDGGPRGIIIHKETGKCDIASFVSISMLQADAKERIDSLEMLQGFRKDKSSLTKIKSKYHLTTKEVLQLYS